MIKSAAQLAKNGRCSHTHGHVNNKKNYFDKIEVFFTSISAFTGIIYFFLLRPTRLYERFEKLLKTTRFYVCVCMCVFSAR